MCRPLDSRSRIRPRGFTLVELIVVLVILSILALIGVQFVISSTRNYEDTRTRALLVNSGRQALERMTRQLRGALPYSVEITNGGNCLRFMPIAGGGIYNGTVPDVSNQAPLGSGGIDVVHSGVEFGSANWLSVGALSPGEIYTTNAASSLASIGGSYVDTLSGKRWLRNSINHRFYLLDHPQAFCIHNDQLRFYENLSHSASVIDTNLPSDLLVRQVRLSPSIQPFRLSTGSDNRNTLVLIDIDIISGDESINFDQQVMIRNVP